MITPEHLEWLLKAERDGPQIADVGDAKLFLMDYVRDDIYGRPFITHRGVRLLHRLREHVRINGSCAGFSAERPECSDSPTGGREFLQDS